MYLYVEYTRIRHTSFSSPRGYILTEFYCISILFYIKILIKVSISINGEFGYSESEARIQRSGHKF